MKKLVKKLHTFFSSLDTLDEKLFWTLIFLTLLIGVVSVTCTILEGLGIFAVVTGLLCIALPIIFIIVCRNKTDYKTSYFVFCIILNCVIMPLVFLTNGGLHSGMPLYCVGSLMLCSFTASKRRRYIGFAISFVVSYLVFFASIMYPQIVTPLPDAEYFTPYDIILSYGLASFSLLLVISMMIEEYNTQRHKELNNGLIDSLGSLIEFRSIETGNHAHNMKKIMAILLKHANKTVKGADFTKQDIEVISSATVLHDIGKIAIPDSILNKPGELTNEEREQVKNHTVAGCTMIESMKEFQNPKYFEYCYEICRHHHERYDGNGYPDGLKGEEIPLISQLASVADVFEALAANRSYKEGFTPDVIFMTMTKDDGHWSSQVIDCFKDSFPELLGFIKENKKDE